MEDDLEICHCFELTAGEIRKAIIENGLKTVEEVGEITEAGTMCGGCIPDIEDLLFEING